MSKVKIVLGALAIVGLTAPAALAEKVDDPVGVFTDAEGNAGYAEVDPEGGAVRICNENPEATPAGDELTGYIWVNPAGEETPYDYGNEVVGAGDEDGEGAENADDCP